MTPLRTTAAAVLVAPATLYFFVAQRYLYDRLEESKWYDQVWDEYYGIYGARITYVPCPWKIFNDDIGKMSSSYIEEQCEAYFKEQNWFVGCVVDFNSYIMDRMVIKCPRNVTNVVNASGATNDLTLRIAGSIKREEILYQVVALDVKQLIGTAVIAQNDVLVDLNYFKIGYYDSKKSRKIEKSSLELSGVVGFSFVD